MQRMDRLRRSLRDSFRRKRDAPESSKPHQWQADEEAVRSGNCTFNVKYLGCVEVFESRGMQVCEEAMKVLRQSRRRPVKSLLYVSGDGLRVVEDDTKGLIVDQTIEKVSFCAPDRNHERGFSYICRDGTTRRWMCHGFLATKDSGERLSHAVGCAFAACLERKQKREKECGVSMTYDPKTSTFTRSGSFRVASITDSLSDKSKSPPPELDSMGMPIRTPVINTHAIERPHAPVKMLERQGSFRGFSQLANQSPFKRQLSLRLSDLPSNLQRTQQNNIDILTNNNIIPTTAPVIPPVTASPTPPPRTQRNRMHSLPNNSLVGVSSTSSTIASSTIPENTTNGNGEACPPLKIENKDLVSELCQQVTQGLSLLAANHDDVKNNTSGDGSKFSAKFTNPWDEEVGIKSTTTSISKNPALPVFNTAALGTVNQLISSPSNVISSANPLSKQDSWLNNLSGAQPPKAPMPSKPSPTHIMNNINATANSSLPPLVSSIVTARNITVPATSASPTPPVNPSAPSTSVVPTNVSTTSEGHVFGPSPGVRPSLVNQSSVQQGPGLGIRSTYKGAPSRSQSLGSDPFDADWAAPVARTGQTPTNPFVRQQTFQVSM